MRPFLRSNFQNTAAPRYFSLNCATSAYSPSPSGAGYWLPSTMYSVFGVTNAAP